MRKIAVFVFSLIFLTGCAKQVKTAEQLLDEGMMAVKEKDYGDAVIKLKEALSKDLPPSKKEIASFALAESCFNKGDYVEAAVQYREFLTLYPASKYAKEALYKLGICYMKMIKGPQWDQQFTYKAIDVFTQFLAKYPDDKLSSKISELLKTCRKVLAEHEIYIGQTYDVLKKFTASANRYRNVINVYNDVEPEDKLLYLLGRARFYTYIQANEEIENLQEQLEIEKERFAEAKTDDEKRVFKNRISLILSDIEKWRKEEESGREEGKKLLKELIDKYPDSPYAKKAKEILQGKVILDKVEIENPIKKSFWKRFFETI
ncbi:outer membrane protein assembly factor BamD [Desulfurobacterium atlanticum]|uniref:Beta-barrel assembly machine subunit BamD n=1 Tax=Desulfurobacterium atlanticum TaxID=240169 RepID=A0A238Z1F6_9BACT|nr:outer membrane protein assembly factor BamD [Desulfurobacterium atlanticum]SNR76684.1 Beta-barrel assembly machine subunit BamD [Desulfurobacterium atlanticum]